MMASGSQQVRLTVMISSTARDLPEHRKEVMEGCLRQGMFPLMMEYLPASDQDAIDESLHMVDEADIYLGIFASRYGYIPNGHKISISEMEYNRAVERGIPRLVFLMHKDHLIKIADVELGEGAIKLQKLKARLETERVVNFFSSSTDLRADVINSLSHYRRPDLTAFHYVSDIPAPPEPYIAHPYVLLPTPNLIGRQAELNLLTDWVANPDAEVYQARILSIVAIGGAGKSALTWKWFREIAPLEMLPLAGRLWWSFYESDASFENFVIRALTYVSRRSKEEIQQLSLPERETLLFSILDREAYLLVLDGCERLMIVYKRAEAAYLLDEDLDQQTANIMIGEQSSHESILQTFAGQHRLRRTADPRVGNFFRKLTTLRSSRLLISTRLYPAELQTSTGRSISGSYALSLQGLSDDDALNLWRTLGVSGSREQVLPIFHTFENHPLLIQALAGVVARDRRAPGNFEEWYRTHSDFTPFALPLVNVKSHVLEVALSGLDHRAKRVLQTIVAFRMPATYDTLVALLVGPNMQNCPCSNEVELITVLDDLEDRGLLGWDQRANRYDVHPIVRGVTWDRLNKQGQQELYRTLNEHFAALPSINHSEVKCLEDLTTIIELYHTLIGLERYDEAYALYHDSIHNTLFYTLEARREGSALLELFFPDGREQLPLLRPELQTEVLKYLGLSLLGEQPGQMVTLFRRALKVSEQQGHHPTMLSSSLANFSLALYYCGALYEAEIVARRSLYLARQSYFLLGEFESLCWLGRILATRGVQKESTNAFKQSSSLSQQTGWPYPYDHQAQHALWFGRIAEAQSLAEQGSIYYQKVHRVWREIRAIRLRGEVALKQNEEITAENYLQDALTRARSVNLVEEELLSTLDIVELRRRQSELEAAHELLQEVWEPAKRGPFRLSMADAYNTLASIEQDAGNLEAAAQAAIEAYSFAWCDGPPFAYYWGLQRARKHLAALRVPEPNLPLCDPTKYEPMPDVKL